jgi:hypothetical protein
LTEFVSTSESFVSSTDGWEVGLVGQIGVSILDENDAVVLARSTSGVTETTTVSEGSTYSKTLIAPSTFGHYTTRWDDGLVNLGEAFEDLIVDDAGSLDRLKIITDYATEPVLSSNDLSYLLSISRVIDPDWRTPDDTNWEPTYDVLHAAAQGWLLKASRLVNRYLFMSGGKMFARQQMFDHCMMMYKRYASKSIRAVRMPVYPALGYVPNNAVD